MADRTVKVIIQDVASGEWGIPEFQRKFEWKHEQVATLCNSLYKDLPIGLLTVWKTLRDRLTIVRFLDKVSLFPILTKQLTGQHTQIEWQKKHQTLWQLGRMTLNWVSSRGR